MGPFEVSFEFCAQPIALNTYHDDTLHNGIARMGYHGR